MRVRANHWVNYNGRWYQAGETFDAPKQDENSLSEFCEIEQGETQTALEPFESAIVEAPKRRGRPRKVE